MIEGLEGQPRLIVSASLTPVVGSAFQPTGFPDLGAAEFQRPLNNGDTQDAVLVESVQSLANHLESIGWDKATDSPVPILSRLPYVEVRDSKKNFLTSSRLEPHRLAGAYIKNSVIGDEKADEWMRERLAVEKGVPLDWRAIYGGIFSLDPMCLIHGVFFSDPAWSSYGNPRVRRVTTAVIEAHETRPVVSGGVKRDDVNPTAGEGRTSKEGYGFVPFGRTEYTAKEIKLDIAIDLEQINGYGLPQAETDLLAAVALWEVCSLLDRPLRLRTACDLEVISDSVRVRRPDDYRLPGLDAIVAEIEKAPVKFDADIPHTTLYE